MAAIKQTTAKAYEASLTSHLTDLKLEEEAEQREPETISDADSDLKLPQTLADSLALLKQVGAEEVTDKRAGQVKEAKLTKIRLHVFNLSQGPVAKPMTQAGHAAMAASSTSHAEEIHMTLLSRGDLILAGRLAKDALTISRLRKQIETLQNQLETLTEKKS